MNEREKNISSEMAELADKYINDLTKIFKLTKKDLSNLLAQNESYLYCLKGGIKSGDILAKTYHHRLKSWFKTLEQELENRNIEEHQKKSFFCVHNTHLNKIESYIKKVLRLKYNHYRGIIKRNGWRLKTTFEEFCNEVIHRGKPSGKVLLKFWCGKLNHNNFRYCEGGGLISKFKHHPPKCLQCDPHAHSTTYNELVSLVYDMDYTLKSPSSMSEWKKMIVNSKKAPHKIKIKVECEKHGVFPTTYGTLQQEHGCPKCGIEARNEAKLLSLDDLINRGLEHGLKLVTPPNQVRNLLAQNKPLEWICVKHKIKINVRASESRLKERAYCEKCSKGKITDERVIRYMLTSMFKTTQFGNKPKQPYTINKFKFKEIQKNQKIRDFINSHGVTPNGYKQFTIDCFAEVIIRKKALWVSVDVWGPQHQDKKTFLRMYPASTPHDYHRQKVYDNLRKLMFEEGLIDIHIVVPLFKLNKNEYNGFINRELERQLLKFHGIMLNRPIPSYTWYSLLKDIKQAKDHQNII